MFSANPEFKASEKIMAEPAAPTEHDSHLKTGVAFCCALSCSVLKFQFHEIALQTVDVYLIEKDKWIRAPDMINARLSHSSCVVGEYIYVTGGHDG